MGKYKAAIYLINFKFHRLDYVQCSSGTIANHDCSGKNTAGLVLRGTGRELRTCSFNLISGECIDENDTCHQPSPSPTTILPVSAPMTSVVTVQSSSAIVMPSPTPITATSSWYVACTHSSIVLIKDGHTH